MRVPRWHLPWRLETKATSWCRCNLLAARHVSCMFHNLLSTELLQIDMFTSRWYFIALAETIIVLLQVQCSPLWHSPGVEVTSLHRLLRLIQSEWKNSTDLGSSCDWTLILRLNAVSAIDESWFQSILVSGYTFVSCRLAKQKNRQAFISSPIDRLC